jgi:hypothetical protein
MIEALHVSLHIKKLYRFFRTILNRLEDAPSSLWPFRAFARELTKRRTTGLHVSYWYYPASFIFNVKMADLF